MTEQTLKSYIKSAIMVRKNAYAKYSGYKVGAVAVCYQDEDLIGVGCNVENVSYGLTICAERNAITNMIAVNGYKEPYISAMILVGGMGDEFDKSIVPCGACLQVMAEFVSPEKKDIDIIVVTSEEEYIKYKLSDFLPKAFTF